MDDDAPYALTMTPAERAAGFLHVTLPGVPHPVVVRHVDHFAIVKAETSTGTWYAIVDRAHRNGPRVIDSVTTLDELLRRFPPPS